MGALEEGMEQEKGQDWGKEMAEGTRVEMMKGEARSRRRSQVWTQSRARITAHDRVNGGRSHGGGNANNTRGLTDGDKAA